MLQPPIEETGEVNEFHLPLPFFLVLYAIQEFVTGFVGRNSSEGEEKFWTIGGNDVVAKIKEQFMFLRASVNSIPSENINT